MKKISILQRLALFTMLSIFLFAGKTNAQALDKGDIVLDLYYGATSGKNLLSIYTIGEYGLNYDQKYSGLGNVGVRGDIMLSPRIGLGVDVNYTYRNVSFTDVGNAFSTIPGDTTYNIYPGAEVTQNLVRAMARVNWVFVNKDKFTMSWANSIGYRYSGIQKETDNPMNWMPNVNGGFPVAFRTALGMRYFITDNIGMNAEVGFSGGSFANVGVSAKF